MAVPGSILSPARRPKWLHFTVGAVLIVIAVALTVGWQILGVSDIGSQRVHPLRFVVYFLGTVLFLLLIAGLVLIVLLLVREMRLNERQSNFVSAYATAHPWEDWAETWAHYFHITDALETAGSFGLSLKPKHPQAATMRAEPQKVALPESAFAELIRHWLPLTHALNELNRGMGIPDLYPFVLSDGALAKLRFVHDVITALPQE